jgi:hypothetical protein
MDAHSQREVETAARLRASRGDLVIIPWQVSYGRCGRCRRGQDAHFGSVPASSHTGGPRMSRSRDVLRRGGAEVRRSGIAVVTAMLGLATVTAVGWWVPADHAC